MWSRADVEFAAGVPSRRWHRLSTYVWGIGVAAWLSVAVVVVAMLWASNVTNATEERARVEEETEAHPMTEAAVSVYRVAVAFGGALAWPAPVPPAVLEPFDREVALAEAAVAALDGVDGIEAEATSMNTAITDWDQARSAMASALDATNGDTRSALAAESRAALASAASSLEIAAEISHSETVEDYDRADTIRSQAERFAVVVAVVTLVGGAAAVRKFGSDLTRMLTALGTGTRQIADGDRSSLLPLTGPAEIVEVASSFNAMAATLREREEALTYRAYHDPLTGLGNRADLKVRLGAAVARLRRNQGDSVALILLDLDRFKDLNDALGHSAGDEALEAIAERITSCVRETDTVCRLGGDEFTIVVEDSAASSVELAERILKTINEPLEVQAQMVQLAASAGISFAVSGAETPGALLRDADLAMYAAKARGGNLIEVFDSALLDQATRRLHVASELREAIGTAQIEVHYQPIVGVDSGGMIGAEALVRWRHPKLGLLAPADFIDIAEDSGLIVPLGAQVLDAAVRDSEFWRSELLNGEQFKVSVNVSARQLMLPSFAADVEAALERHGAAPHSLWVEITETALLKRSPEIDDGLKRLRGLGIRIALDDFGTGYSSLHLINTLNVDIIKVDRSFVTGISDGEDRRALVAAVIEMAVAFGLDTVAEGIESEADIATIRELGATAAQGYWYGRPVPATEFKERWIIGFSNPSPRHEEAEWVRPAGGAPAPIV